MNRFLCLAASLTIQAAAVSQQITVTVSNLTTERAVLSALSGERASTVDSIRSRGNGEFRFTPDRQMSAGMYRLSFEKGKWIDVVYDGEEVEVATDARAIMDSLRVIRSEDNRLYVAFRKLNQLYKTKTEILQLVLARYPHEDPYYATSCSTAAEIQREYREFIRAAGTTRPSSFIARYIRSAQLPVVDLIQPPDRQLVYLKVHALDNVDFTDEGLIHSDLFTAKAIEYLMYYRNPQLPKELLAREFNGAVDSILNRAKVNQAVYRHITEYLIDGFKQFGFEECINYILENYVIKDDLCLEGSGNSVQRMIDQKKRLPAGALAPEFTLPDTAGRAVTLGEIAGEKMLIVFYSTACPHCQSMLPRLSAFIQEKGHSLSVVAVCLDNSVNDWLGFVRNHGFRWTDVIDVQGWSGVVAGEYFLYATPTMFLVNRERKILGKPMTLTELEELL